MSETWSSDNVMVNKEGESKSKYQQVLDELTGIQKNHFLNSEELVEIFDKKYATAGVVQILDEKGEPLMGLNGGARIEPIEFEKIDKHNKETHMKGLLYKYTMNPVDLVEKISKETALLEVAEREGSMLKKLVEESLEK